VVPLHVCHRCLPNLICLIFMLLLYDVSYLYMLYGFCQDGRLRVDDRLLEVNGVSLLGQSNIDAMETLRYAMHSAGPDPGSISIAIARPTAAPAADAVAMATNDAVGRTPCLRQTAASNLHQSRGLLMPPPSSNKVLSTRKSRVCPFTFYQARPYVETVWEALCFRFVFFYFFSFYFPLFL